MEVNSQAELILSTHPKVEGEIKQLFSITADFINGKATRLFFPQQLQYFLHHILCLLSTSALQKQKQQGTTSV